MAANIIHEFYAKNDPNLIIKFLLCSREDGMDSFSRARMPDLATNNTIDTIINVDNRLMGLGCCKIIASRGMWVRYNAYI